MRCTFLFTLDLLSLILLMLIRMECPLLLPSRRLRKVRLILIFIHHFIIQSFIIHHILTLSQPDMHRCGFKYSRETRIFLKQAPDIKTCHDIMHLYPWLNPTMPPEQQAEPLTIGYLERWYVFDHVAYLYSAPGEALNTEHPNVIAGGLNEPDLSEGRRGMRCESTITIKYPSYENFLAQKRTIFGEWSLRIYSTDDGLGEWDDTIVAVIDRLHREIINEFGDPNFVC